MNEREPRTVLVLAYYFPPVGGAGVQRVLKFVKYLPDHGYRPVVITTRAGDYPAKDRQLLAEIPDGTPVVRARDPAALRWARAGFYYLRLERLALLAGWPDPALAWIPAACVAAVRAARRYRPDVIFSSAPPLSVHLVAAITARATGLPWVADFRDEPSAGTAAVPSRFLRWLSAKVERRVIGRASRLVTVADYFVLPAGGANRRLTIANGIDPADLEIPAARPDNQRFRLSFVGTLYSDRDLAPVTTALRRLAASKAIDPARFVLELVGNVWLRETPDAGQVPVAATGYVDHPQAIAQMRQATALLFYAPASSPAPSGKIFEYLACERPILCVARADNLAFSLVHEWRAGYAAEPGDSAAIEAAILELYRAWEAGRLVKPEGVREKVIERYSRAKLAGTLAEVFDAAVTGLSASDRPASET